MVAWAYIEKRYLNIMVPSERVVTEQTVTGFSMPMPVATRSDGISLLTTTSEGSWSLCFNVRPDQTLGPSAPRGKDDPALDNELPKGTIEASSNQGERIALTLTGELIFKEVICPVWYPGVRRDASICKGGVGMTVTYTSLESYRNHVLKGKCKTQRDTIFQWLVKHSDEEKRTGFTRNEMSMYLAMRLASVCGRVSQLIGDEFCIEVGERPDRFTGVNSKIVAAKQTDSPQRRLM